MQEKTCQICGEKFTTSQHRKIYCSDACFKIAYNKQQNDRRRKKIAEMACGRCGTIFVPENSLKRVCKDCRRAKKKKRVDRAHVISVEMKPSTMSISSMGHLAKTKEPDPIDVKKNSPKLNECYQIVPHGKAVYFPKTKSDYERLINRLNQTK